MLKLLQARLRIQQDNPTANLIHFYIPISRFSVCSHYKTFSGNFSIKQYQQGGDVDEAEIEPLSSFGLKRGGRETKTPIKYQDMEWKTVQERGKHGHRGRRSKC
ncbi:hypothetical protein HID58_064523 [Brassica napus]|uniref:Uncharacterized protein n=1 Tax=Brassica napus TaxID=3708 RepID=A0ABQ7ZA80_BRANA|nr:hypothetical protein HID58_064523 [Brassica napus]